MNRTVATAFAITMVADDLAGGRCDREVVVLCVCCANDLDPNWVWSAHRAPASAECMRCTDERRQREGMLFVVKPRDTGAAT